jgi:signal transduction histidine kinase
MPLLLMGPSPAYVPNRPLLVYLCTLQIGKYKKLVGQLMNRDEISRTHALAKSEPQAGAMPTDSPIASGTTEEERQLYTLCAAMSQGVVCIDAGGEVVMANTAAQSMLAMTLDEMQQRTPLELPWHAIQDDGTSFSYESHPVMQALQTDQHISGVIMGIYHPKEQTYHWLKVDVIPLAGATEYASQQVVAILQDYTGPKHTQKALDVILAMTDALRQNMHYTTVAESRTNTETAVEERLAHLICHLLNCQRVGIALLDSDTENLHLIFVMGISPEHEYHWSNSLQGVRLVNFLGDPSLVSQLHSGEVLSLDISVPLFNDQISYKRIAPILFGIDLVGILIIGYEHAGSQLTIEEMELLEGMSRLASLALVGAKMQHERDQSLTELREVREELARVDKLKSNFVAVMSHEVRSALTGIQGFSELMRDANLTASEMKEFAVDIHSDARRIVRMISDMLDLNRMEDERIELNPGWLDLNAMIVDAVSRIRPTTHSHLIRMQLARALPVLLGDHEKLVYVIMHLLANAIKYSPDGGEVVASTVLEDGSVHASVRDHGVGIPAIDIERIFERYARTDTGRVVSARQGLPLVREVIQLHGGQVWVESILGAGSTIHFTIPFTNNR